MPEDGERRREDQRKACDNRQNDNRAAFRHIQPPGFCSV
jgi:hypothetical protein